MKFSQSAGSSGWTVKKQTFWRPSLSSSSGSWYGSPFNHLTQLMAPRELHYSTQPPGKQQVLLTKYICWQIHMSPLSQITPPVVRWNKICWSDECHNISIPCVFVHGTMVKPILKLRKDYFLTTSCRPLSHWVLSVRLLSIWLTVDSSGSWRMKTFPVLSVVLSPFNNRLSSATQHIQNSFMCQHWCEKAYMT